MTDASSTTTAVSNSTIKAVVRNNDSPAATTSSIEALKAYLHPLLEKYHSGKTIVYEDLQASWKVANQLLKKAGAPNSVVVSKNKLHLLNDPFTYIF